MPALRRMLTPTVLVFFGIGRVIQPAQAQEPPPEPLILQKLLASTGAASDRLGAALAVSGDVLVATAPSTTVDGKRFAGAAYVFLRDQASGEWIEHKQLVPEDSATFDQFGDEVTVDGDTVVVGASFAKVGSVFQQGAVYVFERDQGGVDNWGQVAKLTEGSGGLVANFGSSVALKDDLLAVGASRSGGNGAVTIYERDRGGPDAWGRVTTISDSAVGDGGFPLKSFGRAVAIDGDLLVAGASAADVSYFGEDDGAAYVFRRDPTDRDQWNFIVRLTAPEATLCPGGRTLSEISLESLEVREEVERCAAEDSKTDHDAFGGNLAIAGDIIVVSAAGSEDLTGPVVGAAYVFRQDPAAADRWDQIARLAGSDLLMAPAPGFGGGVALAGDTLLVGAAGAAGPKGAQGAAYLFERGAGGPDAWGETGKLVAGDGLAGEAFGSSVAFDGTEAIVGASGYEAAQGAVYLAHEDKPAEPAFPPIGELVDGGIVEGPAGVVLSTSPGAITEPLPVWIVEVPPPAQPLDPSLTAIGAFYNIGSSQTTTAADGAQFGLALPVPAGADTERLAAAVLVAARGILDGPESGEIWLPITGVYDQASNLFRIPLYTLTLQGQAIVLTEDPNLQPLPLSPTSAARASGELFKVTCRKFTAPDACGPSEETSFELLLEASHAKFTGFDFADPRLAKTVTQQDPPTGPIVKSLPYCCISIHPFVPFDGVDPKFCEASSPNEIKRGAYVYGLARIYFCLILPPSASTATHELFHAFQHGNLAWNSIGERLDGDRNGPNDDFGWVSEGTATAAENSASSMIHDGNQSLHAVDHGLTSTDGADEYQAQDFWIYFGMKNSLGLGYLKPLFERGGTTEVAAQFFAEVHSTSLGVEYWGWVKNQAIEKTFKISDAMGENKCHIVAPDDDAVIGSVAELEYPPAPGPEGPPASASYTGSLSDLTAKVVRIKVTEAVGRTTITAGQPQGLAYKVYLNGDPDCAKLDGEHPENVRTFSSLAADSTVYVVLANIEHQRGSRIGYKLEVKPAPPP